jgi:tetratricopeptide (TPR) repeat protein
VEVPTDERQRRLRKSKGYGLLAAVLFFLSALFSAIGFSFLVIFGLAGMYCAFLWIYYGSESLAGQTSQNYRRTGSSFASSASQATSLFSGRPGLLILFGGMIFIFLMVVFAIATSPASEEISLEHSEIPEDSQAEAVDYSEVLQNDPDNIDALTNTGNVFFERESYDSALYYYDRVLQLDVRNVTALYNKSLVRFNQKDFSGAASLASQCIQIAPGNTDALMLLGDCYESQGNHDLALAQYDKAYEKGVRTAGLSNMMAYLHDKKGNTVKAILFYKETLELDSSRADVYTRLAELEPERKKWYEERLEVWKPK